MKAIATVGVLMLLASGPAVAQERIVPNPAGCPRVAFCGCGVSMKVFGKPVRSLFLARNWLRFPRARAAAGMVAGWGRHHVAYIISVDSNGNALLYDPNSGDHRTRIHTRSLRGAWVVNPGLGYGSSSTLTRQARLWSTPILDR